MGSAGGAEDWGSISLCKLTHRHSDYSVVLKKILSVLKKNKRNFSYEVSRLFSIYNIIALIMTIK